jgi:hypothetical protein
MEFTLLATSPPRMIVTRTFYAPSGTLVLTHATAAATAPKPTVGCADFGGGGTKPDPSVVSVETQSPVFTQVWTSLPMRRALGFDVLTFPCNDVGGMMLNFLEQGRATFRYQACKL